MSIAGAKFRLADDIRHRRVLDEAVVVRQESNEVIVINEVSASILEFFGEQGEGTAAALIDYLAGEYEVDQQQLRQDIQAHIEELIAAGIIVQQECEGKPNELC